ncbi:MAG: flagellar basal-body rod protein FlgG [Bacteroidota bacterium]
MLRALRTAALGMNAQQTAVDNTANNLANANTTAYKESRVVFQDLLYQTVQAPTEGQAEGVARPATLQMGHGAAPVATVRSFKQGSLIQSGNPLDLAINGDGFFQILRPDGTISYTRDGSFMRSAEGEVITQNGLPLEPGISIPEDTAEIIIGADGVVQVRSQGAADIVEVGQIEIVRFSNPAGLQAMGGNLFDQTEASGEPIVSTPGEEGAGLIRQAFLESGNVDVVQEMVNLITSQRAYEINSKMVTTSEEMLQIANNMKR